MGYKIYSIESRKGGVGKTTIALNLAKTLRDKKQDVLLIDCDITGTPITEAACHSPFWSNVVDVVCTHDKPCNLIQYFETIYLKGGNIKKDIVDNISLEQERIHVIGSEIYNSKGELIIDPRLLMDDLHSYWFVCLIKEIIVLFQNKSEKKDITVILDNSPGYVGIGKSIREWLTTEGYEKAHFVLVSSLDEQDVESTVNSALDIEAEMIDKWQIAHLYDLIVNHEEKSDELQKLLEEKPRLKEFYYSLKDNQYRTNLEAKPQAKDFISVVINKVPVIYRDEHLNYNFRQEGSPERDRIIEMLFPQNEYGYPLNVIEYDTAISGQFIESNITSPESDEYKQKELDKVFNGFDQKRGKYVESQDKIKQAVSLAKSFGTLNNQLIKLGYKPLVDSLGFELRTDSIIQEIISFVRSLGNVVIPKVDQLEFERDEIYNTDRNLLSQMISGNNLTVYSAVLYSLFNTIYKKAGFKKKTFNKYLVVNLSLLFKMFLNIQDNQCKKEGRYHLVLMHGHIDKAICKEALGKLERKDIMLKGTTRIYIDGTVMDLFNRFFPKFYQDMCYTLLRLIDYADDLGIIAHAYRATIMRKGRTLDADLRQYIQDVVVRKTEEFNSTRYNELVEKPYEMQIVQEMLNKLVLNR